MIATGVHAYVVSAKVMERIADRDDPDGLAAIAQLPRKQRATLILRTYHEMSHQEIADILGSSVGAVKANFFHALGSLKKILGEDR